MRGSLLALLSVIVCTHSQSNHSMLITFTTYTQTCTFQTRGQCSGLKERLSCSDDSGCTREEVRVIRPLTHDYPTIPHSDVTLTCSNNNATLNITAVRYQLPRYAYCRDVDQSACDLITEDYNCMSSLCEEPLVANRTTDLCGYYDNEMTLRLREQCLQKTGRCLVTVPRRLVRGYEDCYYLTQFRVNCSAKFNLCYALWAEIEYSCVGESTGLKSWAIALIAVFSVLAALGLAIGAWHLYKGKKKGNDDIEI